MDITAGLPNLVSEEHYRALIESLAEGVLLVGSCGRVLSANPSAVRILGVPAEHLLGVDMRDTRWTTIREDGSPWPANDRPVLHTIRTGEPLSAMVMGLQRHDGTLVWLSINTRPVEAAGQRCALTSFTDITAVKEAELALRASESRYRSVVENIGEGVVIRDRDNRVVAANGAALRIYGVTLEELKAAVGTVPGCKRIDEDGREMAPGESPSGVTLRTGQPVCDHVVGLERRDGTVVWLLVNSQPMCDQDTGEVQGAVVSLSDITARRAAERALREREELSRLVIENMAEGVLIRDRDGRIIAANESAARIFGVPRSELIGAIEPTYVRAVIDEDGQPVHYTSLPAHTSLREGLPTSHRVGGAVRKDGSIVWVSVNARLIQRPGSDEIQGVVSSFEDITARRAAEIALRESEARFAHAVRGSFDGIWDWDIQGGNYYISPRLKELLGYADDELPNERHALIDRVHPADLDRVHTAIKAHFERDVPYDIEVRLRHKDGGYRWFRVRGKAFRDAAGRPVRFSGANTDISDRKRAEEQLALLAQFDSLTGLPNRNLFLDRLAGAIARAKRNANIVALFFLDLDRFKEVNDSLGHQAGDALLLGVGERLRQRLRETDTVARLAGDEFAMIVEGIEHGEQAGSIAAGVQDAVSSAPLIVEGQEVFAAASIGIALYPTDADSVDELLKCADRAMYAAKREGGGAYQYFMREDHAVAPGQISLVSNLRRALERNEFELEYQPQIQIATGRVIGVEALLRWRRPGVGLESPLQFIHLAEETGLIIPIGEWVLETACRQAVEWQHAGIGPFVMAVNISARQFRHRRIAEHIEEILARTELAPPWLELEITESTIMQQTQHTIATLKNIEALGVRVAIDDFGTGYSSLAYLKRFPVHKLKIDRTFVRDITSDPDDAVIVRAITTMAGALQIATIAEGVETAEQLTLLRALGCAEYQGYLFSKPVPPDKLPAYIARQ